MNSTREMSGPTPTSTPDYSAVRLNEISTKELIEALPQPEPSPGLVVNEEEKLLDVEVEPEEELAPQEPPPQTRRGILIAVDGDTPHLSQICTAVKTRHPHLEFILLPERATPTGALLALKPGKFFYARDSKDSQLARALVRAANALEWREHVEHVLRQGGDVLVSGYVWSVVKEMNLVGWGEALSHVERAFGPLLLPDLQILLHEAEERPSSDPWLPHPRITQDVIHAGPDSVDEIEHAIQAAENCRFHEMRRFQDDQV